MKLLPLLAPFILAGCATPWKPTSSELDLTLSPTVNEELRKQIVSSPKAPLKSINLREIHASAGNFGALVYFDSLSEFSAGDMGLLGERVSAKFKYPENPIEGWTQRDLTSLCGLVDVASDSHSQTVQPLTTQAGSSVINTGVAMDTKLRSRLDVLTSNSAQLCAPVLGSTFTFQTQSTLNRKIESRFYNSHGEKVSQGMHSCVVDAVAYPAKDLNGALRGDYMKISCDAVIDEVKTTTTYGYLIDSQRYLMLKRVVPFNVQTNSYHTPVYKED